MARSLWGWPGRVWDRSAEAAVIGVNGTYQALTWFGRIHRVGILGFIRSRYSECFEQLDGGDKRMIRAFLDPDSVSNTYSLVGGPFPLPKIDHPGGQLAALGTLASNWLQDALGVEAEFDNSFVEREPPRNGERWFFINGIANSRELARDDADALRGMFQRPITLIHNPTQGLTNDLVESALQKFTNINTEPVARAFLEVVDALLDEQVQEVVVIAHSQGTIITGDVLDLIYCSIDRAYFDRTNMNDEDFDKFIGSSTGTVKSAELVQRSKALQGRPELMAKLQLYMFANGASRMCYLDPERKHPHIESYANHHDIVTRLGSLARGDFWQEDLIRIDGSLFSCDRYGHLLQPHYLDDFKRGKYSLLAGQEGRCIGTSVHDPVRGNPGPNHPAYVPGSPRSRLYELYLALQQPALAHELKPTGPTALASGVRSN